MDSSMWSAAFNLTNVITGSGIIGLPYAAHQCGLLIALILLLVTAAATHYSLQLLVWSAHRLQRKRSLDMEDVMYECFGSPGRWAALLAVFFLDAGVMVALLIVIGDTVPPVLAHYLGPTFAALTSRRLVLSIVSILFILPPSSMRSLSSLALVSLTSIASVLILTAIVIVRSFSVTHPASSPPSSVRLVGSSVLSGFGSIAFVFVCQDVSLQLFQSMRVRSPLAWKRVATASVATALLPILVLTVVGYVCFVGSTQGNILNNFSTEDAAVNVARIVLGASMVMTYPSNLFMCRLVLTRAIQTWSSSGRSSVSSLHYPLTVVLFVASLLCALVVEDLGVVQSIVGSVCAVSVAFLIPSACAVQIAHKSGQPYASWANGGPFLIIVFGLVVITLTVVTQIAELVAGEESKVVHTAHVY